MTKKDYLKFESDICGNLTRKYRQELDADVKEMMRLAVLDLRVRCRDIWIQMGHRVPSDITFGGEFK